MSTTRRAGLALAATTSFGLLLAPAAQAAPTSAGTDSGSTASTAPGYDRTALHQKIKAARNGGATGLMVEITSPKGTYRNQAGYSNVSTRRPAKVDDQYHIASVTKTMVAALVMKEIEKGNWTLNTRVHDVFPNLYLGGGNATVGQLLSHRSGMPNHTEHFTENGFWEKRWWDTRLIAIARQKPFYFTPGTKQRYSNTGYVVLGKMLEKENDGKTLAGLLHHRIFQPAGMTSSRLSLSQRYLRSSFEEIATINGRQQRLKVNPSIFSGSGGVESTTRDVNRFYKALFSGTFVPTARVDEMLRSRTSNGPIPGYGLGIYRIQTPCGVAFGHDGASFGTRNYAFTSQDGKTQVNVAWNGRSWDSQSEPPTNEVVSEAFRQTCTPSSGNRAQSGPVAPGPDVDKQHSLDPSHLR